MAEPITLAAAVITGLVGAYKAYTEYRAAVDKAKLEHAAPPAQSAEAKTGQQVAAIVQQHGDDKDRNALAQFDADPDDYRGVLETRLARLAERNPIVAQQLQTLAQQANIQTGGITGNVNISDSAKVKGTVAGVNAGTITSTYTDKDE